MKLIKAAGLIDDLAAAVAHDELSGLAFSVVKRYIMRQDAVDAVEVVRCKDCKYGEQCPGDESDWWLCHYHGSDWNKENHYCSFGERREQCD